MSRRFQLRVHQFSMEFVSFFLRGTFSVLICFYNVFKMLLECSFSSWVHSFFLTSIEEKIHTCLRNLKWLGTNLSYRKSSPISWMQNITYCG